MFYNDKYMPNCFLDIKNSNSDDDVPLEGIKPNARKLNILFVYMCSLYEENRGLNSKVLFYDMPL